MAGENRRGIHSKSVFNSCAQAGGGKWVGVRAWAPVRIGISPEVAAFY